MRSADSAERAESAKAAPDSAGDALAQAALAEEAREDVERSEAPVPEPVAARMEAPAAREEAPKREAPRVKNTRAPDAFALRQAMTRLEGCVTMQDCLQRAESALALFGSSEKINLPGEATIDRFRETQVGYRRGQADVLRAAKALAGSPAGRANEPELRQMFELLPQSEEWMLSADEIEPLRKSLDRAVRRWMADRRVQPQRSIGLMVEALTPTRQTELDTQVSIESGSIELGSPELLRAFVQRQLASAPLIQKMKRQRLVRFKLVISPSQTYAMD